MVILTAVSAVIIKSIHLQLRGENLKLTKRHRGVTPQPKAQVEGFSERGMEGVERKHLAARDSVEGDDASRVVHVNCHSVRRGRGRIQHLSHPVEDKVAIFTALQTPGLSTWFRPLLLLEVYWPWTFFKPRDLKPSFPSDHFVSHSDEHVSFPLHLAVTAISHTFCAQNLTVLGCIWRSLCPSQRLHLCVVVEHPNLPLHCITVQWEFTGIW